MATKFTPLHDRILVRRVEEADTTRGGIIIPDSAKDKPQEGEVISAPWRAQFPARPDRYRRVDRRTSTGCRDRSAAPSLRRPRRQLPLPLVCVAVGIDLAGVAILDVVSAEQHQFLVGRDSL